MTEPHTEYEIQVENKPTPKEQIASLKAQLDEQAKKINILTRESIANACALSAVAALAGVDPKSTEELAGNEDIIKMVTKRHEA